MWIPTTMWYYHVQYLVNMTLFNIEYQCDHFADLLSKTEDLNFYDILQSLA